MRKTLIGPRLRQLRRQHNHTQAEMARRLNVSAAYVNLLENNQRSLSVKILMALSDAYGLDPKTLVSTDETTSLANLRDAVRDPVFSGEAPDLQELRAAFDHSPRLVDRFLELHRNYRMLADQIQQAPNDGALGHATAQHEIDRFLQSRQAHFPELEVVANTIRARLGGAQDDMYALLKRHLRLEHRVETAVARVSDMPDALMQYDASAVTLSEALDQSNRNFQLAHVVAQIEAKSVVKGIVADAGLRHADAPARLEIELYNYVAAAILMPYTPFLDLARRTRHDLDRLAAAFGATFEQVCQRLVTLQAPEDPGIPFFFLRLDRAGNVTKRYACASSPLADQGGSCPVWNIHGSFQTPSVIRPQFVELPEGGRYFTVARTTDRPVFSRATQDRRLVVALGCPADAAADIIYARGVGVADAEGGAPIGLSCHTCLRQKCSQRAHQPLHVALNLTSQRRGISRYES